MDRWERERFLLRKALETQLFLRLLFTAGSAQSGE